jgi:hypothetical protein
MNPVKAEKSRPLVLVQAFHIIYHKIQAGRLSCTNFNMLSRCNGITKYITTESQTLTPLLLLYGSMAFASDVHGISTSEAPRHGHVLSDKSTELQRDTFEPRGSHPIHLLLG